MKRAIGHPHGARTAGRPHPDDEAGYALILGAAMMVCLLLTTALVVDVGAVYSARRKDQNAADTGALAAAQDLKVPDTAAATAVSYTEGVLGVTLSASQWNSCAVDAGALAVRATGRNCISFNGSRTRVRVRVPDQYYQTSFAKLINIKRMRHTAFATAGVAQRGFGGVLPFGMPAGAGSGEGYACIKSNSGGQSQAPCNGPESGNFGTIDLTFYGSEELGTTKSCGSGDARTVRIPNNIAVGGDHELSVYTTVERIDATSCTTLSPLPNAARTETGNLSNAVDAGLLSGHLFSDGGPARLQRTDPALFAGAGRMRSVNGDLVDDNGLWSFIPPDLTSSSASGGNVPVSCQRNQFVDSSGTPTLVNLPTKVRVHVQNMGLGDRMLALMTRCFAHYAGLAWGGGASAGFPALNPAEQRVGCTGNNPCTDPVFGYNSSISDSPNLYDIQYTSRFAYVPELSGSFPSGSSQAVRFRAFRPVFIQRASMGTGAGITNFDPGVSSVALNPGKGVREVTIWVFPDHMLPGGLQEDDAAYGIGVNRFVQLAE